jgi:UPF0755 protein
MRRSLALVLVFAVVVPVGGAVLVGTWLWARMNEPYQGYPPGERFVTIPSGSSTTTIGRLLADAGVVSDPIVFRAAVWWSGEGQRLKAGEYRFDRPMTPAAVAERLATGDVYVRRLTIPEGLTIAEMAELVESGGFGDARMFASAAADVAAIRALDPGAKDLEGYLFPDTYALPRSATPETLVGMMVGRFLEVFSDSMRESARAQGLTVREAVTLASLIEEETAQAEERPLVAAVYRNRLRVGMGMQADPTVVYALRRAGRYTGNIRREDLDIDSPYNTYRYPGLPPGPIASPGAASLEAALAPADVDYLYFVSRNDGTHVFAETLADHNRNVQEWQVRFFQRQRQGQTR